MNVGKIARISAKNGGSKIMPQRRFDAFDRLIGPGFDRHRLAPALHAVLVGQPDQYRRPRTRLEELEFSKQRIVEPFDVDPGNPSHLGGNPLRFPRPSPVLRPYPGVAAGLAPSLTIWLDRREQNYRATGISSEKDAWAGQRRVRGIRMTDACPYCLGTGPRTRSANAVAFAVR